MGSIKSKIVMMALLVLSTMIARAQNDTSDKVLDKYHSIKASIESRLKDYRLLGSFYFDIFYHRQYSGTQSRYYKGVDLSLDGMVDSAMRKRIIQLLNDEYSDGEYDRWIGRLMTRNKYLLKSREEAIEIAKEKKWNKCDMYYVIKLCGGLKDDEIKNILINIYEDKDNEIYDEYKNVTLKALARMGVEPYLSMFVEKHKYPESDDPQDMEKSVYELWSVPCKETMLEISRYLSSEKYAVSYIEADSIVGDTIYEEEEIELVPIELESYNSDDYGRECHDYIKTTAFLCLVSDILNPELLSIVGVKRDEELFLYSTQAKLDALLTPRKCRKIQRWMKKNYNNYDLSGSW